MKVKNNKTILFSVLGLIIVLIGFLSSGIDYSDNVFVLFGILKEFTLRNRERIKILLSFILPSLSAFLWVYPHNRMLFIAFPLLVLLGSSGILRDYKNQKTNKIVELSFLSGYFLISYIILEFLLRYGTIIQPIGTLLG